MGDENREEERRKRKMRKGKLMEGEEKEEEEEEEKAGLGNTPALRRRNVETQINFSTSCKPASMCVSACVHVCVTLCFIPSVFSVSLIFHRENVKPPSHLLKMHEAEERQQEESV